MAAIDRSTAERPGRARVVVVGAGIAGLMAAHELVDTYEVVVLDKGRGVGGRLATRRIGDATFDHGAQFVTTHTPWFAEVVGGWEQAGVATAWFHGQIGPDGLAAADGHARFRGVTSMNAIAKHLATGIEVRTATLIGALEPVDGGWRIHVDSGQVLDADAVILTAPVPQSLALLHAGGATLAPDDEAALGAIAYDPCLAALVPLDGPSGLGEPGAIDPADGPIDWLADNQRKGISTAPAVTIHATAAFSAERWDAPDHEVIAELVAAAGLTASPIDGAGQVQRWRYARPIVPHPEPSLTLTGLAPIVLAGDAFGGPKVEGAARSGAAAAAGVRALLEADGTGPS